MRKCGVYFVIREMDKSEPDAEISQVGRRKNENIKQTARVVSRRSAESGAAKRAADM